MRQNKKQILRRIVVLIISVLFLSILLLPVLNGKVPLEKYVTEYSSFILIFLTYIYVLLTYEILHSNNLLSKEQLRPYVIANFIEENHFVYLSIKNFGKRPAFDVTVNLSEGFDDLQFDSIRGNYKYLLQQKFIAPSQEIKNVVADAMSILSSRKINVNKCFDLSVIFFDSDSKKYELKYQIDFNNRYDEKSIRSESVIDGLKNISKELKDIKELISKLIR